MGVLVIYSCITNYPQILQFKRVTLLFYLTLSTGQESRDNIAGWFLFKFFHKIAVKLLAMAVDISNLDKG